MAAKVKKGDRVVVLAGHDKGARARCSGPAEGGPGRRAGRGQVKRHAKPTPQPGGQHRAKEAAIHVSNVAHLDPKDGKPTRVGFKFLEDGRKVRFAKRSGEVMDR